MSQDALCVLHIESRINYVIACIALHGVFVVDTWAVETRGDTMYGASRQPICMLGENLRASMKTSSKNHAEGRCLRGLLKRCPVTASSKGTACLKVPCPAATLFSTPVADLPMVYDVHPESSQEVQEGWVSP